VIGGRDRGSPRHDPSRPRCVSPRRDATTSACRSPPWQQNGVYCVSVLHIGGKDVNSTQQDGQQVSVLGRANALLSAFEPSHRTLTLSGLVMRTGLPKSTVHRTAQQMIRLGWLSCDRGQFSLGTRMFELARLSPVRHELREAALPFMEDLYEATHVTVHLGVREGLEVLYVEKISGHRKVTELSSVGGRMPLHCTALGKAILAFSSSKVVDNVVQHGLARLTKATITSPARLRSELGDVATTRVALDHQEADADICCAAAAVLGPDNTVVAALSVTAPIGKIEQLDRLAPAVLAAARGVSRALAADRVAPTRPVAPFPAR
jgi:DNA-binding IclR family transcriptional regulator